MYAPLQGLLAQRLADVRASGLYKQERLLDSAQGARVRLKDGRVLKKHVDHAIGSLDNGTGHCRICMFGRRRIFTGQGRGGF